MQETQSKQEATEQAALPAKKRIGPPTHERERETFRHLILANPNYFGNLEKSEYKPVLKIKGDMTYEELMCVGLVPEFDRLEAIVYVKQKTGYAGDLCSAGSQEYVRFYLSWDDGATWHDQGVTSFTAHNITSTKPLEYAVSLDIKPEKWPCGKEQVAKVRAILSWNSPPPANAPHFVPVWGNVRDAYVQIDVKKRLSIIDVGGLPSVKLEESVAPFKELQQIYRQHDVPDHRQHFTYLTNLLAKPALTESLMAPGFPGYFQGLDVDPAKLIEQLLNTKGNTSFEELKCVGLNTNLDTLEAVLTVKRPAGYGGGLCHKGTREYVAFWLDWGDGAGWTYAGTASVKVHDITHFPKQGINYAVFLPLNSTGRRRPCKLGAVTPKVRAILSWEVAPPAGNPDFVPVWGNRDETNVQIKPGPVVKEGAHTPFIETVGGMSVADINNLGLANGTAVTAGFTAQDSPFGALVVMTGHLANPTMPGSLKYKISVSSDGSLWQPLIDPFDISITKLLPAPVTTTHHQTVDPDGWYTYMEGPNSYVAGNVLAKWQTSGLNGLRYIKMEAKDSVTTYGGFQTITIELDNKAPDVAMAITTGGGNCADFNSGAVISGTYSWSDEHFGHLSFSVEPGGAGTFTSPAPPQSYPAISTTGEPLGHWTLNTTGMPKCGYVIRLTVWDRTIVNSAYRGFHNYAVAGLCIR